MTDALTSITKHMNVIPGDTVIEGRGEPCKDPTTGFYHVRFTRPGVEGEFHAEFKVSYQAPFKPAREK